MLGMIICAGSQQLETYTEVSTYRWNDMVLETCFQMLGWQGDGKLYKKGWQNAYDCWNSENKTPVKNWVP